LEKGLGEGFKEIGAWLGAREGRGLYRQRRVVENPQGREMIVDGVKLLNFCGNDYLGLANDPRVASAFKQGVDQWGTGSGASHLICGHSRAHHELEEALADFVQRPRALLFSSGYAANVGTINALVSSPDCVYEDRLNHASLLDGGWISRAQFHWFEHADMADLDRQVESNHNDAKHLIVTDGTFSMDGDACPLRDMIGVAKRHDAWVMVDDAHGLGVVGDNGCGLVDPNHFGTDDVQVLVGTLGKAFGTSGAFVAGEEDLIEYLIQRARNYIFSTAMPSAIAAATLASVAIVTTESWRREHLEQRIQQFRSGALELGFDLAPSMSPIQPLLLGTPQAALEMSRSLEADGCFISAIRPPTVPEGTSRLRITLTAAHTEQDVDRLLHALERTNRQQRVVSKVSHQ
jgi:8-amino-7-oxononanoate synthase